MATILVSQMTLCQALLAHLPSLAYRPGKGRERPSNPAAETSGHEFSGSEEGSGRGREARGRGGEREGKGWVLTSDPSTQNVTLAIAVFTILTSIYFFNKVSGKRAGVAG